MGEGSIFNNVNGSLERTRATDAATKRIMKMAEAQTLSQISLQLKVQT